MTLTLLGEEIRRQWMQLPDGSFRRPGSTCNGAQFCHIVGDRLPHSHYIWAESEFFALYGDIMGGGKR